MSSTKLRCDTVIMLSLACFTAPALSDAVCHRLGSRNTPVTAEWAKQKKIQNFIFSPFNEESKSSGQNLPEAGNWPPLNSVTPICSYADVRKPSDLFFLPSGKPVAHL
ncbi:hypothetical protein XENORESO_019577, partial [Xenotaenia resolanae]